MDFYDYQRPVGKIDDVVALRDKFIQVFDTKTKRDTVLFGILYGKHLIETINVNISYDETDKVFKALQRWLDGQSNYHESRNIAFKELLKNARFEKDLLTERFYRTMAQIASIPHVKFHALWSSDFAITLINIIHPNNMDAVISERELQIKLLKQCETQNNTL